MTIQNERAPAQKARGAGAELWRGQHPNRTAPFHVTHASAQPLLDRLDGLQKSGTGWRARCPSCGGTSRKLSVTERDNRVLVHCFSCGDSDAILAAVGLAWADLHPPRHWPESPEERRQARRAIRETGWSAALSVLKVEATVARIAAAQTLRGEPLELDDWQRLAVACERIDHAAAVLVEASSWRPGGRA